jgi:secreted PhoX family phosphatase
MSREEIAEATFSPDSGTLVNIQAPGTTFAIWGSWG